MYRPAPEDFTDHQPKRWPAEAFVKGMTLTTPKPEPRLYEWRGLANPKALALFNSWRQA